jgi:NADH dehydrogenase FAD-containing subunit
MTVLKNLDRFFAAGHRATVVSASALHYYSGMGPGMLSGIYRPEEIRFDVKKMVEERGGRFVIDEAVRIDPAGKAVELSSGERLTFDVASFNTGSFVPIDDSERSRANVFTVKPIERLLAAREAITAALKDREPAIVVVGGGPAGLEISGNLRRLVQDEGGRARINLVAGSSLLAGFSRPVKQAARDSLARRGIRLLEGVRADHYENGSLVLTDGNRIRCDFLFYAIGVKPGPIFADSDLPTGPDGGLLVNAYLQSVDHPEIFGGGDCISFEPRPLAKVGVYAVRQNAVLLHNLLGALDESELQKFVPQDEYLLAFNMGDGTAILSWKTILLKGRLGFFIKDHIDRKFMKSFQVRA